MTDSPEVPVGDQLPAVVTLRPWRDPIVERLGFPVRSAYVEAVWLPVLGPSCTWALRRLGLWASTHPSGLTIDLGELAAELGLRADVRRSSPMARTLSRMQRFAMITWANDELLTRTAVGPVPERHLLKLPNRIVQLHHRLVHEHNADLARDKHHPPTVKVVDDDGREWGRRAASADRPEPPSARGPACSNPLDVARRRLRSTDTSPELSR